MAIIITMLVMGVLLGFVGAGGAGFIIAILTLVFRIPIHVALATSLTAMAF
ncbi:sulfite exporter TauE/SafE family protein, partial [Bacillus wiedmannii]|nr:sulfite exporter TauE/SafE family protein [Bacillus wiedmannii]